MKTLPAWLLCAALLAGCGSTTITEVTQPHTEVERNPVQQISAPEYETRFADVTEILLSDTGITVDGGQETESVFTSRDMIYYEDRDAYESGNPYGEGGPEDRHTAEEAAAHLVVNITRPGAYRVSGRLSAGQIRVDLGEDACDDPDAVVELILENADITCTAAPAILFLNTYECDGSWSAETASAQVDTAQAGANLILEGENVISGSYVARIYRDQEGEKKLWKQDGAVYSYMSMNVFGPGSLELNAENEGMDTELHLTINSGSIRIFSGNDGINTNEDGVSVTTINGGDLQIIAGLGEEGDGIDSNGYLVINGGRVVASANPAADAGLDSDMGSFIHGGTVIALGSSMDWAESDSRQVTMNLQFAAQQTGGSSLAVTGQDGKVVFAFAPEWESEYHRPFSGVILSGPWLMQGDTCTVALGGVLSGNHVLGLYDPAEGIACEGGTVMCYTGTDVGMGGPGGRGMGGGQPGGFDGRTPDGERMPEIPQGDRPAMPGGEAMPEIPEGGMPAIPEGGTMPELPEGMEKPEGRKPAPGEAFPERGGGDDRRQPEGNGLTNREFYLNDMVNCFSGITAAQE